jgi:ABC-type lipoprotein release transport system permease subunit
MALQLPPRGTDTLSVIVPKREGFINPAIPASSFLSTQGKVASVILSENEVYDNTLFMDLQQLQQLLNYTPSQVDGVALEISRGDIRKTRQQLLQLLPNHYILLDRSEQQPEITRLVAIEKWISFLILFFVLLLAAFNVVACVSMLMIEKQFDTLTLRALGASPSSVTNIFRYEGLLITAIGAGMGLLLGLLLCYSQMELGWITTQSSLGPQPYPVKIKLFDLAASLTAILGIGYLAAAYPAKVLSNKYYK